MENPYDRFSKLPDGRVLDSEPMKSGDWLSVFDKSSGKWIDFEGTLGEWRHSIAITAEEATRLTSGAAQSQSQKNPHAGHAKNKLQSSAEDDSYRYSFTRDYRLLDHNPMALDKTPLVFDPASGQWVDFDGVFGLIHYSIPVTPEEAALYCQDGTIPAEVRRMIVEDVEAPEPEEE